MTGAEYLTAEVLRDLWTTLDTAFAARLASGGASIEQALHAFNPAWNIVGRVYFHLAENRKDPDAPFAFLATYTHGLSATGSRNTSRSARRSASTPAARTGGGCSRCSSPCSVRRSSAGG